MEKIDNVNVYTLLIEKDSTIIHCSDNLRIYLKLDPINHKLSTFLTNETYEYVRKMMLECLFTNKEISDDVELFNRFFRVNISPVLDEMTVKNLLLTVYDITRNKKIEEEIETLKTKLEESNSIKSVFLSNMSHELRTPMNAIIGFSDILLSGDNKDQYDRFLKSINSNAKHLDELLNNILDSSRLESKEFDLLYEKFSINDLFDDLLDIFEDVNYKKNLDFVKLEFLKKEDIKIVSDYLRLKQVLFNIISNAIKFTEKGFIRISYEVVNDVITIKIEDTGIGIEESKLQYIFERFWQCDSSSTKKYKGTGLGLSISKKIIALLEGKIWVNSTFGKGTTFYIKLHLGDDVKHEIIHKNKINFSGKSVLIIDELPINYSLLGMYLNSLNINIISAYSTGEAIQKYKKQKSKIDLIFLDINLPDDEFHEFIQKFKKIGKSKIVSKSSKHHNKLIDYYLQKPINKDELLSLLNKVWQK